MLNLYKLEVFAIAAQEGSFSKAAERLLLTQSAISQHVNDLESSLGTKLFNRGRRGVTLTSAGETLFDYTQRIFKLVTEAENAVTNVEQLTHGQVNIGATPGISVYLLPTWIQRFRRRYPKLTATVQTDVTARITANVLNHRLDLGFVEGELEQVDDPRLGWRKLEDIDLLVVVGQGNPHWNVGSLPAQALNGQPFIVRQQNSQTRIWLDGLLARHGIYPNIVGEFDNPETIKQAVISGMGMTILPEYIITHELTAGLVRAFPLEDLRLTRTLKILWNETLPLRPISRAFLEVVSHDYPSQ